MSDRLKALMPLIEALDGGEFAKLKAFLNDHAEAEELSPVEWESVSTETESFLEELRARRNEHESGADAGISAEEVFRHLDETRP